MWTLKLLDTECSKSIAGRGVDRLISWLGTAGPVDCLIDRCLTVILEYIDLFGRVQPTFGWAYSWLHP